MGTAEHVRDCLVEMDLYVCLEPIMDLYFDS